MQDYDGRFVPGYIVIGGVYTSFGRSLQPYLKSGQILVCPSDAKPRQDPRHGLSGSIVDDLFVRSYMPNPLVHGDAQGVNYSGPTAPVFPLPETQVTKSAETVSFLEAGFPANANPSAFNPYPHTTANNQAWMPINTAGVPSQAQLDDTNVSYNRHLGGANYLFCDGHVKFLRWEATLGPSWLFDPVK